MSKLKSGHIAPKVENIRLELPSVRATLGLLQSYEHVTSINCSHQELKVKHISALSAILKTNTTLTHLELSGCCITRGRSAEILSEGLRENHTLTFINLRDNKIGAGVQHIAAALEDNSSLVVLDLCNNKIPTKGILPIASLLRHNTHLLHLDLSCNDLSEGIAEIGRAIGENRCLTSLAIRNNGMSCTEEWALARGIAANWSLCKLDLAINEPNEPSALVALYTKTLKRNAHSFEEALCTISHMMHFCDPLEARPLWHYKLYECLQPKFAAILSRVINPNATRNEDLISSHFFYITGVAKNTQQHIFGITGTMKTICSYLTLGDIKTLPDPEDFWATISGDEKALDWLFNS